jgi:hypothetical protein
VATSLLAFSAFAVSSAGHFLDPEIELCCLRWLSSVHWLTHPRLIHDQAWAHPVEPDCVQHGPIPIFGCTNHCKLNPSSTQDSAPWDTPRGGTPAPGLGHQPLLVGPTCQTHHFIAPRTTLPHWEARP